MDLSTVDGIYWSMITMTTIGYGDISGSTPIERAVLCLYLPTAVAALADALGAVQTIATARDLVDTDFSKQADHLLLGEAGGENPDPEETLTEAEFLVSVLKDKGIVDELTVRAIRLQFAHITRHDTWSVDQTNKVLDDRVVFLELKAQGRILPPGRGAPTKNADGMDIDHVDITASDGGFKEWRERYWLPRVYDGRAEGGGHIRFDTSQTGHQETEEEAAAAEAALAKAAKAGAGGAGGGGKGEKTPKRAQVSTPSEPPSTPMRTPMMMVGGARPGSVRRASVDDKTLPTPTRMPPPDAVKTKMTPIPGTEYSYAQLTDEVDGQYLAMVTRSPGSPELSRAQSPNMTGGWPHATPMPPAKLPIAPLPKRMGPPTICDQLSWMFGEGCAGDNCAWVFVVVCLIFFLLRILPDVWAHERGVADMPEWMRGLVDPKSGALDR